MLENKLKAFERLLNVMDELREKCPWDRVQTFDSLKNNTIEEVYELMDAIADKDMSEIKKELGDVLLHIVFYSKIAEQLGEFDISDVANSLCDKLIYRHPHVYGDAEALNAGQVSESWEQLKQKEVGRKKGVMSGVPDGMPAMVKALRIGQKAANAGFDWEKKEDVWDKVKEEILEIEQEIKDDNQKNMQDEFGDLFFALINAARLYKVDPEAALSSCNKKFIQRFNYVELKSSESERSMKDISLSELEQMWCEAKQKEKK
ncbi:MAG: nucleoside triphosphate pyrophosphohydrolase [Rikenellaceae bacterium]